MTDLENMTNEELAEMARERGIPVDATMTKDELVRALGEADASEESEVVLRAEDKRWIEVREEMAQLHAEVERARLEREREEDEVLREHEQAWLERQERLERARAREEAIVRRAQRRARELRELEEIAREYAADEPPVRAARYRSEPVGVVGRAGRGLNRLICTTADAASNAAVSFADTMLPASEERARPTTRRRRSARSTPRQSLPRMTVSTARRTFDATLNVPRAALDTFYDEYGMG